jgi:hypothetical protein
VVVFAMKNRAEISSRSASPAPSVTSITYRGILHLHSNVLKSDAFSGFFCPRSCALAPFDGEFLMFLVLVMHELGSLVGLRSHLQTLIALGLHHAEDWRR